MKVLYYIPLFLFCLWASPTYAQSNADDVFAADQALQDLTAFTLAQEALKRGDYTEIERLMKPLAARGNAQAISTLQKMGIANYTDTPTATAPEITPEQKERAAQEAYNSCSQVPSKEAIPAAMTACDAAYIRLSNLATGDKADLYYYYSGLAAYQLANLQNIQTANDFKTTCPNVHKADRQFRRMATKPTLGTEHFAAARQIKSTLMVCKDKGF